MALEGSLAVFQLPEILQMVALQNKTGILTVQGEQDIIAISFLHGGVVAADALNQTTEEGLGQILAGERLVRPDQFAAVVSEHQNGGGRLTDLLLQKKLLDRAQLLRALRAQTYNLLLQTLRWKDGSFKFYGGDEVSYEEGFQPISVEELLIRSISEQQSPEDLPDPRLVYEAVPSSRAFRTMDHTFAGVREGSGVWLKAEERALLERLDGQHSAEELARTLALDEHKLRFALYRLQEEGLARVVARSAAPPAKAAAPLSAARPEPARPPADAPLRPGPRPVEGGSKPGVRPMLPPPARSAPLLRAVEEAARPERALGEPVPMLGRSLAALLAVLLIGGVIFPRGTMLFPLPWQAEERDVFQRTQRTAQFLKIDRAARTACCMVRRRVAPHTPSRTARSARRYGPRAAVRRES